jgi:carbon storage regulator
MEQLELNLEGAEGMLSITRKPGESFTIGDDIRIIITRVQGSNVRIAIEAPQHLKILRDDAIVRENKVRENKP